MAHLLKNDQMELTLLPEQGCYWRSLRTFFEGKWRHLLEPVPDQEPPFKFGSYLMAPWSNRIVRGLFRFKGKSHQLRLNCPDQTAIHGDVRCRPWKVETAAATKFSAVLDSRDFSDFNFPFKLKFKHSVELKENKIRFSLWIENVDQAEAPVGMGFHPFFKRRFTERDQDAVLILPAEKVYPDVACIPTAPAVPVSGKTDLRSEKLLGNPNLDHCYTGLTQHLIRLIYPGSKAEIRFAFDPVFSHAVIYAPQDQNGQAKDFVAIEPVTHVNNGFNFYADGWLGTGIYILQPKEVWGGNCELTLQDSNRHE